MKKKHLEALRKKTLSDLNKSVDSLRIEIAQLYAKKSAGELNNVKEIKHKRHELAIVLNIVNIKKLENLKIGENKKEEVIK